MFLKWRNNKKALEYLKALHNAGSNDPYLQYTAEKLNVPNIKNQHIHGWWYLFVNKNSVNTYLNWQAFFEDKKWFKFLEKLVEENEWEFLLMVELRVTDIGYVSAFNSHPFQFVTKNGYEWFLFYNGLLDYEKLAKLENIDYKNFEKKNGTMIMALSIANELEKWTQIQQALQTPKKALKSGYNLMSFVVDNNWKYKAFVNAYAKEELLEDKKIFEYYKLIKKEEDDIFFAGSSVIQLYKKWDYQTMKNGELLEFDIDFIKEYYFDAYNQ